MVGPQSQRCLFFWVTLTLRGTALGTCEVDSTWCSHIPSHFLRDPDHTPGRSISLLQGVSRGIVAGSLSISDEVTHQDRAVGRYELADSLDSRNTRISVVSEKAQEASNNTQGLNQTVAMMALKACFVNLRHALRSVRLYVGDLVNATNPTSIVSFYVILVAFMLLIAVTTQRLFFKTHQALSSPSTPTCALLRPAAMGNPMRPTDGRRWGLSPQASLRPVASLVTEADDSGSLCFDLVVPPNYECVLIVPKRPDVARLFSIRDVHGSVILDITPRCRIGSNLSSIQPHDERGDIKGLLIRSVKGDVLCQCCVASAVSGPDPEQGRLEFHILRAMGEHHANLFRSPDETTTQYVLKTTNGPSFKLSCDLRQHCVDVTDERGTLLATTRECSSGDSYRVVVGPYMDAGLIIGSLVCIQHLGFRSEA